MIPTPPAVLAPGRRRSPFLPRLALLALATAIPVPALAQTASGASQAPAPLIEFDWDHDVFDFMFRYEDARGVWGAGWSRGQDPEQLINNWWHKPTSMNTSQPGTRLSMTYWGSDVSFYGKSDADITLEANGQPVSFQGRGDLIASTGSLGRGYNTVNLTVNSGFLKLNKIRIRHWANIRNV
jgi:hypothetical protein